MIPSLRQQQLVEYLHQQGRVCFLSDIVTELKISESTVRRDLKELEQKGQLTVLRGGGVSLRQDNAEMDIELKLKVCRPAKEKIARYAASLVKPGDVIFLDPSSTCYMMIEYLRNMVITVVTNSCVNMSRLLHCGIPCIMIGGQIKASTNSCIGGMAEDMIRKLCFNKCFLGANGLTPEMGLTNHDPSERSIKQLAMQRSAQTWFLLDASKVGNVAMCQVASIDSFPILMDTAVPALAAYDNIIVVPDRG